MARMARMVATQVLEPLTADFVENCAESAEKKLSSSAVLDQGKRIYPRNPRNPWRINH
jgi:hypothetical protein